MSKKIVELARDLGVANKDLIQTAADLGIEAKNLMSNLSDGDVDRVKSHYHRGKPKSDLKVAEKPVAKATDTPAAKATDTPAAKATDTPAAKATEKPAAKATEKPAAKATEKPAAKATEKPVAKATDTPVAKAVEKPAAEVTKVAEKPVAQPEAKPAATQRPRTDNRPQQGERKPGGYQGNKPASERPQQGERKPGGYQGNKPASERPQQGERKPGGYQGNKPASERPQQGERKPGGYQGNKPTTGYQGNKPASERPQQGERKPGGYQGNKPTTGYQGNKPGGYQGSRPNFQDKDKDGGSNDRNRGNTATNTRGRKDASKGLTTVIDLDNSGIKKTSKDVSKMNIKKVNPKDKITEDGKKKKGIKAKGAANLPIFKDDKPKKSRAAYRKEKRDIAAEKAAEKAAEVDNVGVLEEDGVRMIQVPDTITVKDLSLRIGVQTSDVVKVLFDKGLMATANQEVDYETSEYVAGKFDVLIEKEEVLDILETFFKPEADLEEELEKRSPVVVVMGHVDHGKTSLLDAIRDSSITDSEHGGITQHIGASVVRLASGETVTFLDTPGHEAFTAMRLRGAMATDIAILVVAADDGVMPQTVEAINHAKAAGVQIIVAINKIDKPGANPERVKQELTEYGLVAENWGGDTIMVEVSAIEKTNLEQLLEMVLLVAEVESYKANPNKKAKGIVIESKLDKGKGPVATLLVQEGTLKVGDSIVAGSAYGRIRALFDTYELPIEMGGPSTPVEILGLSEAPLSGETFYTAKNEREARHVAEKVRTYEREKMMQYTPHKVTLDDIFTQIQAGEMKELKLIIKADVQGSVEAMKQSLLKLTNEEVRIVVIHGGVGAITESDVMLASASNAIIIGFNVRPEVTAKVTADREEIDVRLYRVIYNAIEDIELAMKGMLEPIFAEKVIGQAEVRQTFKVSNVGTIAGCYMIDGKMSRNAKVRVIRDGIVIFEGVLDTLKRFKDDVKEVAKGYECGITVEKFNDVKEGDIIEGFIMEEIQRS